MQANRNQDACHEYLSQLVERFRAQHVPKSPLTRWAMLVMQLEINKKTIVEVLHQEHAFPDVFDSLMSRRSRRSRSLRLFLKPARRRMAICLRN